MREAVEHLRREIPQHWPEAVYVVFGHVADSNIHIDVALRDMDEGIKNAVRGLGYDLVTRLGGSISAEHGIGRIKRPYLPLSRTEPELGLWPSCSVRLILQASSTRGGCSEMVS
jgi:FAD/FMN-containing dehydrogenase